MYMQNGRLTSSMMIILQISFRGETEVHVLGQDPLSKIQSALNKMHTDNEASVIKGSSKMQPHYILSFTACVTIISQ
jgi:hypothetical protein